MPQDPAFECLTLKAGSCKGFDSVKAFGTG